MGGTPGAPPPPLDIVRVTSSIWKTAHSWTFTGTPLGHCPRDVIRPLKNWKTPPLLDIHKHPPPLDIARVTSSTFQVQGGGGDRSVPVTHTLHRFAKGWNKIAYGQYGWNKILGMGNSGGGASAPPLPWLRAWYRTTKDLPQRCRTRT